MDPKTAYWTGALLNMTVLTGLALAGIRSARSGDTRRHRRLMGIAACLVVLFLVSYVAKVRWLGREDFETWSSASILSLRIHETCVAVMLLAGVVALSQARRLRGTRAFTRAASDPPAPARALRAHRIAGRVAAAGAVFGWLTAIAVLAGMIARSAG